LLLFAQSETLIEFLTHSLFSMDQKWKNKENSFNKLN